MSAAHIDGSNGLWSAAMEGNLCSLWAQGVGAAEIGQRLKVSANTVSKKARRMGLPKRPFRAA